MGRARGQQQAVSGGASGTPGRRGPYKWTPERIEEELSTLLADRDDWPTQEEFRAAGQIALYDAVKRHGGIKRWAAAMGIDLGAMQDRAAYPLSRALREAVDLIQEHGRLPGAVRLSQLGHPRLAYLVQNAGGARAFVAQHGLVERR